MPEERLELVTSFESLRVADLTVCVNCAMCGETHRSLLIRLHGDDEEFFDEDGNPWAAAHWDYEPPASCDGNIPGSIGRACVDERRLYRVVIPPAAETHSTATPKKLERQGVR